MENDQNIQNVDFILAKSFKKKLTSLIKQHYLCYRKILRITNFLIFKPFYYEVKHKGVPVHTHTHTHTRRIDAGSVRNNAMRTSHASRTHFI